MKRWLLEYVRNWRWLVLDHVPPELRLSREERAELRDRLRQANSPISWRNELTGFAISLPLVIVWFILVGELQGLLASGLLWFVVRWGGLWLILAFVQHLFMRPPTLLALRGMGYDLCIKCGYWLRGLGDDVENCPECGREREAAV